MGWEHRRGMPSPRKGVVLSDETKARISAARGRQINHKGGGPKPRPATERFEAKIAYEPMSGCHLWMGGLNDHGYGVFGMTSPRGTIAAHVFADDLARGPIPPGLERDHTCGTRSCVNAAHIERVTHLENIRRAHQRAGARLLVAAGRGQ